MSDLSDKILHESMVALGIWSEFKTPENSPAYRDMAWQRMQAVPDKIRLLQEIAYGAQARNTPVTRPLHLLAERARVLGEDAARDRKALTEAEALVESLRMALAQNQQESTEVQEAVRRLALEATMDFVSRG